MSREAWSQIKASKGFNVSMYRMLSSALLFSVGLNGVLALCVSHIYFNRPDYVFYSTDGASPPALLTPMNAPNNSAVPILSSDPETVEDVKVIPQ